MKIVHFFYFCLCWLALLFLFIFRSSIIIKEREKKIFNYKEITNLNGFVKGLKIKNFLLYHIIWFIICFVWRLPLWNKKRFKVWLIHFILDNTSFTSTSHPSIPQVILQHQRETDSLTIIQKVSFLSLFIYLLIYLFIYLFE